MFKLNDTQVKITNPPSNEAGVVSGDSVASGIAKILSALGNLVVDQEVGDFEVDIQDFGLTNSSCATVLLGTRFNYEVETTASGLRIGWDIQNSIDGFPTGYTVYSNLVELTGQSGLINRSTSVSSGLNVQLTKLPAILAIKLIVSTPCGLAELNKRVQVASTANVGTYNPVFDVANQSTEASSKKLSDVLQQMALSIASLNQRTSTNSVDNITERVNDIASQLAQLPKIPEPFSDSFTYTQNGVTKKFTLQQIINDIGIRLASLETKVDTNTTKISNLS